MGEEGRYERLWRVRGALRILDEGPLLVNQPNVTRASFKLLSHYSSVLRGVALTRLVRSLWSSPCELRLGAECAGNRHGCGLAYLPAAAGHHGHEFKRGHYDPRTPMRLRRGSSLCRRSSSPRRLAGRRRRGVRMWMFTRSLRTSVSPALADASTETSSSLQLSVAGPSVAAH